jgi:hypothetical protein
LVLWLSDKVKLLLFVVIFIMHTLVRGIVSVGLSGYENGKHVDD